MGNTWCDNYYCGSFCEHELSNAVDNCEATMGDRLCCSEVFTNCAEVQLVGESNSTQPESPTTAAPSTVAPTSAAPIAPTTAAIAPTTIAPTVAPSTPAPPTSGGGQGACMRNRDCAVNPWCADTNYDSWC